MARRARVVPAARTKGAPSVILPEFQRVAALLVLAGSLAACCAPTTTPGSVQQGSGTCGAYFTIADPPAGGARR